MLFPLSALNQLLYCPHRCLLMHRCGEMEANIHVWKGRRLHRRADRGQASAEGERKIIRARPVESQVLGVSGVIDVVEFTSTGAPLVVEYKHGRAPTPRKDGSRDEVWHNDAVQVCAQVLCLEEQMGVRCQEACIYYEGSGERRTVVLTETLREETRAACARLGRVLSGQELPPAVLGPHCEGCSVREICLPEAYTQARAGRDPWGEP